MRSNPAVPNLATLLKLLKQWNAKTGKGSNLIAMCEANPDGFGAPFLTSVNKIMEKVDAKKAAAAAASQSAAAPKAAPRGESAMWLALADAVDEALPELPEGERAALKAAFRAEAR
jgi:hypothetical protein